MAINGASIYGSTNISNASIYGSSNIDYWLALNEIKCYQVMLLLIVATFSRCLLVTGSCKGTITINVRLQNTVIYKIYNSKY